MSGWNAVSAAEWFVEKLNEFGVSCDDEEWFIVDGTDNEVARIFQSPIHDHEACADDDDDCPGEDDCHYTNTRWCWERWTPRGKAARDAIYGIERKATLRVSDVEELNTRAHQLGVR